MIEQLKFVGIPTRDQERALAFWTNLVGFELETDQAMGPQRWIELRIPGGQTRIALYTPEGHEDRVGTFFNGSFQCANVQATYDDLSARGVEFAGPPERQPWGTFATFYDPDGNSFVLSTG